MQRSIALAAIRALKVKVKQYTNERHFRPLTVWKRTNGMKPCLFPSISCGDIEYNGQKQNSTPNDILNTYIDANKVHTI